MLSWSVISHLAPILFLQTKKGIHQVHSSFQLFNFAFHFAWKVFLQGAWLNPDLYSDITSAEWPSLDTLCKRAHPFFSFTILLITYYCLCVPLLPCILNPCTNNRFHECRNVGLFYPLMQFQYLEQDLTCSRNSTIVD